MFIFEVATFYLAYYLSNQLIFFSGSKYHEIKIHVFDEAFFVLAIVAMIAEKVSFSYFHGNVS